MPLEDIIECLANIVARLQGFFIHVAKVALPECLASLKADDSAIYKSFDMVIRALDPADASS